MLRLRLVNDSRIIQISGKILIASSSAMVGVTNSHAMPYPTGRARAWRPGGRLLADAVDGSFGMDDRGHRVCTAVC